uniref:Mitochondrial import inner membrane translocase subunit Tim21 n=1 Tax=Enterobius vermicularis TaxID=51028 RepID=A0A0N4UVX5_ENTVE
LRSFSRLVGTCFTRQSLIFQCSFVLQRRFQQFLTLCKDYRKLFAVVQKAENTFFYVVLAASVGALGLLGYVLFEQFFSYESPQKVFSTALSMIRADERCQELFGSSIAGYGEESARGRRRFLAHQKYEKDGRQRIRVVFHLKGSKARGIAQAEMEKEDSWQWRFLLVQTQSPSSETHVLIDNREPA